ncbi:MAG TPA: sigma-70 family RNA polymerase sigma factor, partial [Actinospica sp.]|nr:sigma-70 family RNA polymerase sigma factor [Actinospica sp.]
MKRAIARSPVAERVPGRSADGAPGQSAAHPLEHPADRPTGRHAQRAETMRALRHMHGLPASDPHRAQLRDRVIAEHMVYARHIARHYCHRSDASREDLEQVAYLGLVKAVDGFDPEYGTAFLGYATPMIVGEIKRHYRDTTWAVHVPR